MNIKTNLFKNARLSFLKLSTLSLIFAFSASVVPQNLYAAVAKSAVANSAEDENFDKKFREGRDLLDKQDWKKASEKFNEVINQYPDNKSLDAALYWLAFCYKKQREFEKVGATVDRLMKDYPSSSWTSDAQILLVEVAAPINGLTATIAGDKSGSVYSVLAPAQITGRTITSGTTLNRALNSPTVVDFPANTTNFYTFNDVFGADSKITLDREDEIRLAAFRSLLSADYTKALQAMNDVFKADSKNSEALKIEVLRALRRPRIIESVTPVERAMGNSTPSIRSRFISDLRDPLFKIFRSESIVKVRKEMIYTLASLKDEQATNYLSQLYDSENDKEMKKTIINGLGSSWGGFNGFYTVSPATIATSSNGLSSQNFSFNVGQEKGDADKKPEFVKLLGIVNAEKDPELRRLALTNVQRFAGWQKNSQMVDILSGIYDSETDENFKKSLIQSLARFEQPQATKKLLDIAKTDKSDKLKLEAIYALGKSKDPAALSYLQQILQ